MEMALVSPPLGWPGLGLKVSNWLGPPDIQSRMQALPWRRSSAGVGRHQIGPMQRARGQPGGRNAAQKIAPADDARAVHGDANAMVKFDGHGDTSDGLNSPEFSAGRVRNHLNSGEVAG